MPEITVLPATPARWDDIEACLGGDGDKGCWCQAWRGVEISGEPRRDALVRQLATNEVPPGFLAYVDDEIAGWAGVSVRTLTPRLVNSRTIPSIDDLPVWSIGCFVVRTGFRRKGVARALLAGIVEAARAAGAPGVEAYPVDPGARRISTSLAFVGIASMFDRAGFRRVVDTGGHSAGLSRILVRLDLA
jgi:GNAT superfamily N-acetyltransferase